MEGHGINLNERNAMSKMYEVIFTDGFEADSPEEAAKMAWVSLHAERTFSVVETNIYGELVSPLQEWTVEVPK